MAEFINLAAVSGTLVHVNAQEDGIYGVIRADENWTPCRFVPTADVTVGFDYTLQGRWIGQKDIINGKAHIRSFLEVGTFCRTLPVNPAVEPLLPVITASEAALLPAETPAQTTGAIAATQYRNANQPEPITDDHLPSVSANAVRPSSSDVGRPAPVPDMPTEYNETFEDCMETIPLHDMASLLDALDRLPPPPAPQSTSRGPSIEELAFHGPEKPF